jgi:subtilase family serine protease
MNKLFALGIGMTLSSLSFGQGWGQGWGQWGNDGPAVPNNGNGAIRPHSWVKGNASPKLNTTPGYLFPSDITTAYGITPSMGGGSGVTVAIVDAYDAPNIAADLATFSTQFGLPACTTANGCFTKVSETGSTTKLPAKNSGWEVEISLDVQWVHAVAPNAKIILVEANSNSNSDLYAAVAYAKAHASIVSMSWGGGESRGQTSSDSTFTGTGVTFLASSGDTGGVVEYPSSSINVIAVGGTNLGLTNGHIASPVSETAWSGSGGGCSLYEAKIAAQTGFVPTTCKNRAVPDVSMDGGTPVSVYISDQGGWGGVYGTSLAVQIYAAFIATVNGIRGSSHPLTSALSDLYSAAAGAPTSAGYLSDFRDITSGKAGSFSAGPGWDYTTGLGSPLAGALAPTLVSKP